VTGLRLQFLTGLQRGRGFASAGARVRIGRSRDNDLVLPDVAAPAASRHHAEAVLERGRWWLVDLSSANGTFVNGRRIERVALAAGDRLRIGEEELLVCRAGTPRRWRAALAVGLLLAGGAGLLAGLTLGERGAGFERAAAAAARATYVIAIDDANGRTLVGTAFAVTRTGQLATNAHVAHEALRRESSGGRAVAVQAEPHVEVHRIVRTKLHPGWRPGSIGDDVAIVELEGAAAAVPLRLATPRVIAGLRRGTPIAAFGFPAVSTDTSRPRGRLSVDVLGDVRGEQYFAVNLQIAPGTSGSPIFLPDGTVIGLVAGGDVPAGRAEARGSGANWGLAVTPLYSLLPRP
jgi:V8-like Glu-specific endopeptidase